MSDSYESQELASQDDSAQQELVAQTSAPLAETQQEENYPQPAADPEQDLEQAQAENQEAQQDNQVSQREILAQELESITVAASPNKLLFFAPDLEEINEKVKAERQARRQAQEAERRQRRLAELNYDEEEVTSRRRRRRRRGEQDIEIEGGGDGDPENTVTKVRTPRLSDSHTTNRVTGLRGSTRLEAKKLRRRESRQTGRRQRGLSQAEFLARRESVDRQMVVRQKDHRIQIGVLEDGILAEHFVSKTQQDSLIGNVYLGKVQNVLPSMEAAFVDIGRGRNAVLYAGEVNWDVSGLEGTPRKIENALKAGDSVLVQVTKDPVGHKGARLTSQVSLPGRFLVYVPGGSMTGISRKLPDTERTRLKKILKDKLPEGAGVIVRTAAEGASEDELTHDINRLRAQWEEIEQQANAPKTLAPEMLYQEPDLTIKTVRDVFNEDFSAMTVQGQAAWDSIEAYLTYMAPDLVDRLRKWEEDEDLFTSFRIDEQLQKALDRKVFLPSGGSLVIDRTEAMTVVDVNTGKFTGSGGNLEETVTKNNLEAAEEIVRQLRLRDIGGIIVIDFIDMVLESNRELVLRRLVECLGRDRTKHQVAEVTSLGLVQMTRKRMGTGLLEVFSEPCEACAGRGIIVHDQPLQGSTVGSDYIHRHDREDRRKVRNQKQQRILEARSEEAARDLEQEQKDQARRQALASIAAASAQGDTADSDGSESSQTESKNARKRKRRKKNKQEAALAAQAQDGGLETLSDQPQLLLTIAGKVVEVPQHQSSEKSDPSQDSMGEQGSFTLEDLSQVFDQKSSERALTPAKKSVDLKAERLGSNSDAADLDSDLTARFTQNSSRYEAIRAGEARARASQKAGRDLSYRQAETSSAGAAANKQGAPSRNQGVSRSAPAAHKAASSTSTSPAQAPSKKKKRPRRAVSSGLTGTVNTEELKPSQGAGKVLASVQESKPPAQEAEPMMLGVGVSASQIKREGK